MRSRPLIRCNSALSVRYCSWNPNTLAWWFSPRVSCAGSLGRVGWIYSRPCSCHSQLREAGGFTYMPRVRARTAYKHSLRSLLTTQPKAAMALYMYRTMPLSVESSWNHRGVSRFSFKLSNVNIARRRDVTSKWNACPGGRCRAWRGQGPVSTEAPCDQHHER